MDCGQYIGCFPKGNNLLGKNTLATFGWEHFLGDLPGWGSTLGRVWQECENPCSHRSPLGRSGKVTSQQGSGRNCTQVALELPRSEELLGWESGSRKRPRNVITFSAAALGDVFLTVLLFCPWTQNTWFFCISRLLTYSVLAVDISPAMPRSYSEGFL